MKRNLFKQTIAGSFVLLLSAYPVFGAGFSDGMGMDVRDQRPDSHAVRLDLNTASSSQVETTARVQAPVAAAVPEAPVVQPTQVVCPAETQYSKVNGMEYCTQPNTGATGTPLVTIFYNTAGKPTTITIGIASSIGGITKKPTVLEIPADASLEKVKAYIQAQLDSPDTSKKFANFENPAPPLIAAPVAEPAPAVEARIAPSCKNTPNPKLCADLYNGQWTPPKNVRQPLGFTCKAKTTKCPGNKVSVQIPGYCGNPDQIMTRCDNKAMWGGEGTELKDKDLSKWIQTHQEYAAEQATKRALAAQKIACAKIDCGNKLWNSAKCSTAGSAVGTEAKTFDALYLDLQKANVLTAKQVATVDQKFVNRCVCTYYPHGQKPITFGTNLQGAVIVSTACKSDAHVSGDDSTRKYQNVILNSAQTKAEAAAASAH